MATLRQTPWPGGMREAIKLTRLQFCRKRTFQSPSEGRSPGIRERSASGAKLLDFATFFKKNRQVCTLQKSRIHPKKIGSKSMKSWTLQISKNFRVVSPLADPIGTEDLKILQKFRLGQNGPQRGAGAEGAHPHKGGAAEGRPSILSLLNFCKNSNLRFM